MANKIEIELLAEIKSAVDDIKKFSQESVKSAKTAQNAFSNFGKVAIAAGASFVAAFAGRQVLGAISDVIDAASKQEDAVNKLNSALKISGQFSEKASQGIQKFASELQGASKFGDEVILENAALIQSLGGLEEDGLKKATQAAADLAAALNIDLASAATLVGKAAAGEIGSFSRYGVIIKKGANNAETFAKALDALNSKFGGAAAAQIKTFSGATEQLANTFGDLKEELGFVITKNPQVIAALNSLEKGFKLLIVFVKENADVVGNLVSSFISLSVNALPLTIKLFSGFVTAIGSVVVGVNQAIFAFENLGKLKDIAFGKLTTAQYQKELKDQEQQLGEIRDSFHAITDSLDTVADKAKDFTKSIKEAGKTTEKLNKVAEDTKKIAKQQVELSDEELRKRKEIADKQKSTLDQILSENKKLALDVANAGADEETQRRNNLKYQLLLIEAKREELKTQGLLTEEIDAAISKQINATIAASNASVPVKKESSFLESVKKVVSYVQEAADIFVGTISTGFQAVFGGGLLTNVTNIIDQALNVPKVFEESFKKIGEVTDKAIDGLASGIKKVIEALPKIFEKAIKILSQIGTILIDSAPAMIEALADGIVDLADLLVRDLIPKLIKKLPELINSLLSRVPELIKVLADNLPVLVKALADGLPDIIQALADNLGPIVTALTEGLATAAPLIVVALVDSFITRGGALKIGIAIAKAMVIDLPIALAQGVANALMNLMPMLGEALGKGFSNLAKIKAPEWLSRLTSSLNGGKLVGLLDRVVSFLQGIAEDIKKLLGQGGGGVVGSLKKGDLGGAVDTLLGGDKRRSILGFAEGGLVPSGFPNDTFPAKLTSGELVIDRSTVDRLNRFIDQGGSSQPIQINLKVGESDLSKVLVNLNRQGFRTA